MDYDADTSMEALYASQPERYAPLEKVEIGPEKHQTDWTEWAKNCTRSYFNCENGYGNRANTHSNSSPLQRVYGRDGTWTGTWSSQVYDYNYFPMTRDDWILNLKHDHRVKIDLQNSYRKDLEKVVAQEAEAKLKYESYRYDKTKRVTAIILRLYLDYNCNRKRRYWRENWDKMKLAELQEYYETNCSKSSPDIHEFAEDYEREQLKQKYKNKEGWLRGVRDGCRKSKDMCAIEAELFKLKVGKFYVVKGEKQLGFKYL